MKKKLLFLLLPALVLFVICYFMIQSRNLNVITGLLFLSAVSLSLLFVSEIVLALFRCTREFKTKIRFSLMSFLILLFGFELVLRYGFTQYSNYYEKNGSANYRSLYQYDNVTWFHVYAPNAEMSYSKPDFKHYRKTNSMGFCEKDIDPAKRQNEFRILGLGDSFTEGIGTDYDSTWLKIVENMLAKQFPSNTMNTVNAGISGSDVFFEYILLKEKLLQLQPDFVIVNVNATDITEIILRGGMERFKADGTLNLRKPPDWEWLYAISYVTRLVIHNVLRYNWLFIKESNESAEQARAAQQMGIALRKMVELSREKHFGLLILFQPLDYEIQYERYANPYYTDVISKLKGEYSSKVLDLLEYYRVHGLITKDNFRRYYWKTDLHYNKEGYQIMGTSVGKTILERNLIQLAPSM